MCACGRRPLIRQAIQPRQLLLLALLPPLTVPAAPHHQPTSMQLLMPDMFNDHLPDAYLEALQQL